MRSLAALLIVALIASGCAEYAEFHSDPTTAKVYINDQMVGFTPLEYAVAKGEVKQDRTYRIEKEGYYPESGILRRKVAPGRIVAAVFTLCISCAFRGFQYFPRVDVALRRQGTTASGESKGTMTERLQRLEDAYDKGLINEREYRRLRSEILKDF